MTWNAKDCLPKQQRGLMAPGPVPASEMRNGELRVEVPESVLPQEPEALPTYLATQQYLDGDETDGVLQWGREAERELAALGIFPEREWAQWAKWITRGIEAI